MHGIQRNVFELDKAIQLKLLYEYDNGDMEPILTYIYCKDIGGLSDGHDDTYP